VGAVVLPRPPKPLRSPPVRCSSSPAPPSAMPPAMPPATPSSTPSSMPSPMPPRTSSRSGLKALSKGRGAAGLTQESDSSEHASEAMLTRYLRGLPNPIRSSASRLHSPSHSPWKRVEAFHGDAGPPLLVRLSRWLSRGRWSLASPALPPGGASLALGAAPVAGPASLFANHPPLVLPPLGRSSASPSGSPCRSPSDAPWDRQPANSTPRPAPAENEDPRPSPRLAADWCTVRVARRRLRPKATPLFSRARRTAK